MIRLKAIRSQHQVKTRSESVVLFLHCGRAYKPDRNHYRSNGVSAMIAAGIALLALSFADLAQVRNASPDVFVCRLPFGFRGMCLPPFGILIDKDWAFDESVMAHELAHWRQYQQSGSALGFGARMVYEYMAAGYNASSYELEARHAGKEVPECLNDYTSCYR